MSNQSGVQQDIRDSTGTAGTWSEDWSALFDADAVAAGTWDERLLAWINGKLSSSYTNVNAAKQAYAVDQGFANWSSMDSVTLVLSGAATLASGETNVFSLDFTDSFWQASTGIYGSAYVRDATTPANNYNSHPYGLLSYTSPSNKLTRKSDGVFRFGAHNLYLNSAAPANQSITVVSGATYSVTITGSVSVTASGAATGTWTAGTNTFTAATGTLALGSTSGAGTVHVRRTPSDSLYLATTSAARYALPFEWDASGNLIGIVREPGATNLMLPSTPTSGGGNITWSANTTDVTDIFGTNTASKMTVTSTGAATFSNSATVAATSATSSVIVRKGSGATDLNAHVLRNGTTATILLSITVNYDTLAITYVTGSSGASIEELGNGWLLITMTVTSGITSGDSIQQYIGAVGDSETAGETLYLMHRQMEPTPYGTSPILTYGAAATRFVDQISVAQTTLPAIGTAYALYFEGEMLSHRAANEYGVHYGTTDIAGIFLRASGAAIAQLAYDGTIQADLSTGSTATANTTFRAAAAFEANDFRLAINGGAVANDNSGTLPTDFTSLLFGHNGHIRIKKVAVFYRELSDAELISLSGTGALS